MAQPGVLNRTSFHFQPQRNWLNDPNAPLYYKGFYHLFYQHNLYAFDFNERMVWGHSVSEDMVNWIQLEPALSPSESFDMNGCWSGSATILPNGKPIILYTGLHLNTKQQVTVVAEPKDASDPLLRDWVKPSYNPVMVPPENIPFNCFRDPTTAWQGKDGVWRTLIGAMERGTGKGMAIVYRSDDFKHWTEFPKPLLESEGTGMWECPDFFPVSLTSKKGVETSVNNDNVKHVLKASFGGHECYVLGKYSSETEEFSAESEFTNTNIDLRYDHGTFYASKAFFDSVKNRRINWGWVEEKDSKEDDSQKGWAGLMSLPREMWLDSSGSRLIQWPIEEIENLRKDHVTYASRQIEAGSNFEILGITAAQADVEVTFDLPVLVVNPKIHGPEQVDDETMFGRDSSWGRTVYGPFGLLALASNDLSEQTAIFFKVISIGNRYLVVMSSDQKKSTLRDGTNKSTHGTILDIDPRVEKLSLRCLIDHSIIESYGHGGKHVITSRVYPKVAIGEAAKLYVFNDGKQDVTMTSLDAWSMRNAEINSNPI